MASLNTLRTRGGIVIAVVIGVALLAFLLTDLFTSGSSMLNSRKSRIGEINGQMVDYFEYLEESDYYTSVFQSLYQLSSLDNEQTQAARNTAWESLVYKYSYEPGFRKLGLVTSDAEQIDMMTGAYISPVTLSFFSDPNSGGFDPVNVRNFRAQIEAERSEMGYMLWEYIQKQTRDERSMSKYINLVSRGMNPTNLEIAHGVNATNDSYSARIARADYSEIPDSLVSVSMADIKKYYNDHKKSFRQTAYRDIEYVVFDVLPSEQDYADAARFVDDIKAEFENSDQPLNYARLNSQIPTTSSYLREDQIEAPIAAALFNNPEGFYGPVLAGDIYTMARLSAMRFEPDTLGARHILLHPSQTELADSIVRALRSGANFTSLAFEHSLDQSVQNNGGDLGRFTPEQMIEEFADAAVAHNRGDIYTVESPYGLHVVELTYKTVPVLKAQYAIIKYKIDPSSATQQIAYNEASEFLTKATGSIDNFNRAATEAALSKRFGRVRPTDRTVNNITDSYELVRWGFNGKRGDVSRIFEIDGDYVVALLTDVREDGYSTAEQSADQIRPILIKEKKADMLMARIAGKNLEQLASEFGNEVIESNDVSFTPFMIDGIGIETRLIGAICSDIPRGTISKPVRGERGVYLFSITDKVTDDGTDERDERIRQDAMSGVYLNERVIQSLNELSDIKDKRVKFF